MNLVDILKILAAGILLFLLWQLLRNYINIPGISNKESETFIQRPNGLPIGGGFPSIAPVQMDQLPVEEERSIVSSGPNPPDQQIKVKRIMHEEQPNDPYAEPTEDAYAPENLRHPDGMFRPAPEMGGYDTVSQSGIASHVLNASNEAAQLFSPEFAQNGGSFMGDVMANDGMLNANYSTF
jgi:hypothetical protein